MPEYNSQKAEEHQLKRYQVLQKLVKSKAYEKSNKFKKYAIEHFQDNGIIGCNACNCVFEKFYEKELGESFIEIHHIKPVCSNCHKMVHRKQNIILNVTFLKNEIAKTGSEIFFGQQSIYLAVYAMPL